MFPRSIARIFSHDLAIDLGTANTLVYMKGKGIVLNEPSVVAMKNSNRNGKRVLAVGREAKLMLGRTPGNITAIRPMMDGVIADLEVAEAMLSYFIKKAHGRGRLVRPRTIIAVPSGINEVEKRAVRESAGMAGASEVYFIEEPMAAAIGAGLPVAEPKGSMIVDIGGGTTEVAVISLGGIADSISVKVAGDKMDGSIQDYIKKKYRLMIGWSTAVGLSRVCDHTRLTRKGVGRTMGLHEPEDTWNEDRYNRGSRVIAGWRRDKDRDMFCETRRTKTLEKYPDYPDLCFGERVILCLKSQRR